MYFLKCRFVGLIFIQSYKKFKTFGQNRLKLRFWMTPFSRMTYFGAQRAISKLHGPRVKIFILVAKVHGCFFNFMKRNIPVIVFLSFGGLDDGMSSDNFMLKLYKIRYFLVKMIKISSKIKILTSKLCTLWFYSCQIHPG